MPRELLSDQAARPVCPPAAAQTSLPNSTAVTSRTRRGESAAARAENIAGSVSAPGHPLTGTRCVWRPPRASRVACSVQEVGDVLRVHMRTADGGSVRAGTLPGSNDRVVGRRWDSRAQCDSVVSSPRRASGTVAVATRRPRKTSRRRERRVVVEPNASVPTAETFFAAVEVSTATGRTLVGGIRTESH